MDNHHKVRDSGFGDKAAANVERFVNKDGTFNVRHINNNTRIQTTYNYLVNISWTRFFLLVFAGYIIINSFFAIVYVSIGVSHIRIPSKSLFHDFLNAFFFSAQTVTTVGYGKMSPDGILAGIVSTVEALVGLLSFSFITGLLYGRFSKPKSYIEFSDKIICRPFKEGHAIMFRLMNSKKTVMIQPKVTVTLSLLEEAGDTYRTKFYNLKLQFNEISYLPTTWTVVHQVDEDSPLKSYSETMLKEAVGEFIVLISYMDESYNQEVHQVYSYTLKELVFNEAFVKAYYFDEDGVTVLDHSKLNKSTPVK